MCTYDGEEEEIMSPDVTHIVAEVENNIHSQVSVMVTLCDGYLTFDTHNLFQ